MTLESGTLQDLVSDPDKESFLRCEDVQRHVRNALQDLRNSKDEVQTWYEQDHVRRTLEEERVPAEIYIARR